ncbi:L-threonylcarbamoyladenylate synthase [Croceibacterium aestuarii]|uniref:L-threonylcarbamoyladenylate synthase n=1 Tax=Croceibacterium aestuarii TaxID=3064139 RepID=UPI00272E80F1|nr:L-threonylcarbamoyladenylate synthase [Croceibacterium sp. D39]
MDVAPEILAPDAAGLARAGEILRAGGLVAVPTETVYGLAARADRVDAVAAIYRAKGRPDFNPLIVHVASLGTARRLAVLDERAENLAARYWPGPLTLVLPLRDDSGLAPAVTAGLPTVALRMPDHPATRRLLAETGLPLAAPSANRSGALSPTQPRHVVASLGASVAAVIDGGICSRGLESTIVALRDNGWQLLRPGPIGEAEIASVLGEPLPLQGGAIEAPGQLAQHYSPGKPLRLGAQAAQAGEFLIGFGALKGDCTLSATGDLAEAAARLYQCLHEAAASAKPRIAVAEIRETGMGAAINDRLRRAAA